MHVFVSLNRKELKGRGRRKKKEGQQLREGPGRQEEVDQLKQGKQMTRRWELGGAGCERKAIRGGRGGRGGAGVERVSPRLQYCVAHL